MNKELDLRLKRELASFGGLWKGGYYEGDSLKPLGGSSYRQLGFISHVNYMFSFGCFCHVSFEGIEQYAVNLYSKLKHGSNCFWMIADHDKYNAAEANLSIWNTLRNAIPGGRRNLPLRWLIAWLRKKHECLHVQSIDEDNEIADGGRWYNAGIDRTCSMLNRIGYNIVDSDVGTCLRDPIVHFSKS